MALAKYSKGSTSAVEIGVYEGVNTVTIANSMSADGMVYGIDPFFKGKLGISYHELIAKKELAKMGVSNKVTLVPMYSFDAASKIANELDFIFIDGDHSFEGIKRDWIDWTNKVKINGIVALHDTSIPSHDPTVQDLGSYKFFNEIVKSDKRFKLQETIDSLNVLVKIAEV